jgi:hypothetical protein
LVGVGIPRGPTGVANWLPRTPTPYTLRRDDDLPPTLSKSELSDPSPASRAPALYQRWLDEMNRRRVFRVIAVYGAVSFVVLEAASVIFPAIPLPDWTVSLVLRMVLLGFPIAVVLAWAFEVTPDGVKLTASADPGEIDAIVASPALTRWCPGLLALGGLALLAAGFYGGRRSGADPVSGARPLGAGAPR